MRWNMVSGVVGMAGNAGIALLGHGVYIRWLGLDVYGIWLMLSTLIAFAQLGDLGVSKALMKLVAEEVGRDEAGKATDHSSNSFAILGGVGALVVGLAFAAAGPILGFLKLAPGAQDVAEALLPWMAVASVHTLILQALSGVLAGAGRMDAASYISLLTRVVSVAVGAALVLAGQGIWGLLWGLMAANVVSHVAYVLVLRRVLSARLMDVRRLSLAGMKEVLHLGSGIVGGSVVHMLLAPFNKLVLTRMIGVAAVPIYELSFAVATVVRAVIDSALRALLPEFSRLSSTAQKGLEACFELLHSVRRLVVGVGAIVFVVAAAAAPTAMQLWLGPRYVPLMGTTVRLLLLGSYFSLLAVPPYYALLGLGKVRQVFMSHVVQGAVNVTVVCTAIFWSRDRAFDGVVLGTILGMAACSVYVWSHVTLMQREVNVSA